MMYWIHFVELIVILTIMQWVERSKELCAVYMYIIILYTYMKVHLLMIQNVGRPTCPMQFMCSFLMGITNWKITLLSRNHPVHTGSFRFNSYATLLQGWSLIQTLSNYYIILYIIVHVVFYSQTRENCISLILMERWNSLKQTLRPFWHLLLAHLILLLLDLLSLLQQPFRMKVHIPDQIQVQIPCICRLSNHYHPVMSMPTTWPFLMQRDLAVFKSWLLVNIHTS